MRSKLITGDVQVATSKIEICGVLICPDGTNAITLDVYNEADASETTAKKVLSLLCAGTVSQSIVFNHPMVLTSGCYVNITCSGTAKAYIFLK